MTEVVKAQVPDALLHFARHSPNLHLLQWCISAHGSARCGRCVEAANNASEQHLYHYQPSHDLWVIKYAESSSCGCSLVRDAAHSADGGVSFDAPAPTYDLDAFVPLEVCAP